MDPMMSPGGVAQRIFVPPLNFGMIAPGVYRSGFPNRKSHDFLLHLGLKTIIYIHTDDCKDYHLKFIEDNGIKFFHYRLDANKEPFNEMDMEQVAEILRQVLGQCRHISTNRRVGCIVGCIRKIQHWALTAIFSEYQRFSGNKIRIADQEFIEVMDTDIEVDEKHKPNTGGVAEYSMLRNITESLSQGLTNMPSGREEQQQKQQQQSEVESNTPADVEEFADARNDSAMSEERRRRLLECLPFLAEVNEFKGHHGPQATQWLRGMKLATNIAQASPEDRGYLAATKLSPAVVNEFHKYLSGRGIPLRQVTDWMTIERFIEDRYIPPMTIEQKPFTQLLDMTFSKGKKIIKFNNHFRTLIDETSLDPDSSDTLQLYIYKFRAEKKAYYLLCYERPVTLDDAFRITESHYAAERQAKKAKKRSKKKKKGKAFQVL
ncbi:tyrosine-protein phosphatase siw14 [Spiromyces aspiralis]|uniref:Tyrosine-protein phosphatase siw14 n=1 Tax=Spiromyces aspiralis TaxID=68401 RepID=A0ACC1HWZ8_9FUNG|nr:tyrosine-protein phosphatase siw14 [Spiromyces aspiralis]